MPDQKSDEETRAHAEECEGCAGCGGELASDERSDRLHDLGEVTPEEARAMLQFTIAGIEGPLSDPCRRCGHTRYSHKGCDPVTRQQVQQVRPIAAEDVPDGPCWALGCTCAAFELRELAPQATRPGDVIQLHPVKTPWGGLFAIVDEVHPWGVSCYWLQATRRHATPATCYYRAEHGAYVRIGVAEWRMTHTGGETW